MQWLGPLVHDGEEGVIGSSAPVDVHIKGVQPPSGDTLAPPAVRSVQRGQVCLDTSRPGWPVRDGLHHMKNDRARAQPSFQVAVLDLLIHCIDRTIAHWYIAWNPVVGSAALLVGVLGGMQKEMSRPCTHLIRRGCIIHVHHRRWWRARETA